MKYYCEFRRLERGGEKFTCRVEIIASCILDFGTPCRTFEKFCISRHLNPGTEFAKVKKKYLPRVAFNRI